MTEDNTNSSSSSKSISLASFNNQGITSKEKLSACCNVKHYQLRRVKNKGAVLVLAISYLVTSILYFLVNSAAHEPVYQVSLIPFTITTAIAGWLTDVFIGRYKVIRCSIWIMWLLMIAITVSAVVGQLNKIYHHYDKYIVQTSLFCLISIGFGAFQSNIIQFGLDQLHDASTTEIKSFIVWYVNSQITTGFFVEFNFLCLTTQNKLYHLLLILCVWLTLALLLIIYFNKSLTKEPPPKYSFKLIYKVVQFAIVTKHPRCRSAFTYCEDELPSRIDFGKSKYGGPFTTEQVEDVKTLLRLLPLISIFGVIASVVVAANILYIYLEKQYNQFTELNVVHELGSRGIIAKCYEETSLTNSVNIGILLLIAFHEFIIYPLFQRCICCARIKSLWKILMGIIIQIMRVTTLIAVDVISRHNYLKSEYNATVQCIFLESRGLLSQSLNHRWLAIPQYLHLISLTFLLTGLIEFICSQAPYSMKGAIIGAQYTLISICSIPMIVIIAVLYKKDLSSLGTGTISCEFWYALLIIIAHLSLFIILAWMVKRYKMRKREDLLPNEHFFAERYYSY